MKIQDAYLWQEIYSHFVALETEILQLRTLLLAAQPAGAVVCRNPVPLGGLWIGVEIADDLIEAAQKSMFAYERKPLDI